MCCVTFSGVACDARVLSPLESSAASTAAGFGLWLCLRKHTAPLDPSVVKMAFRLLLAPASLLIMAAMGSSNPSTPVHLDGKVEEVVTMSAERERERDRPRAGLVG